MSVDFTPTITLEHADKRGEIWSISLPGNKEIVLLHSVPGSIRGGHAHNVVEQVHCVQGRYLLTRGEEGDAVIQEIKSGDYYWNGVNRVHMGEFLEDTWLIEYRTKGNKSTWETKNYEPYRAKVRASIG